MDISKFTVVTDGNIDVEASVERFRQAITVAAETRRNDLEVIANGVSQVFDRFRGAHIQIAALQSFVLQDLKVHPSAYGLLGERVHKYVQEWTEVGNGITETGAKALFRLRKGKGGGWCRISDVKDA